MSQTYDQLSRFLPVGPVNVSPTERVATGGIGGALLMLGLDRGGGAGTAMAALGGVLLVRAVTGHCPTYQAMSSGSFSGLGASLGNAFGQRWGGVTDEVERDPFPHEQRRSDKAEVLAGPQPTVIPTEGGTARNDEVEEASEESFPASDAPAYYAIRP